MKKTIFIFLLLTLCIPYLQEKYEFFKLSPLSGATVSYDKPEFNIKQWMEGDYQNNYGEFTDENFGLRNFFIRTFNQIDFALFRIPHGELVIGRNDYLFQGEYINELIGWNYIGDSVMQQKIENIRLAERYLDSKNIYLLSVLAPGKSDYFIEQIPEYYSKRVMPQRNYTTLIKYGEEKGIRLIDLNKLFLQMKDTCTYPLFPKHGIHWNMYGMAIAADTITKYIETQKKIQLPDVSWTLELSQTLQGTDYDLGDLMNIWQKLPYDKMVYPKFTVTDDSTKTRPRLLVVGDSFYWTIFNSEVFRKQFSNETYFYYCSDVHPSGSLISDHVSDLNFLKEIQKFDIILLLQSSGNYSNPGVNFIQTLLLNLERRVEYEKSAKEVIANSAVLQKRAIQLSHGLHISQDSSISILTDSLVNLRFEEISTTKVQMRNNPEWLQQLFEKSNSSNTPIDQVMQKDAEWMVDQRKN